LVPNLTTGEISEVDGKTLPPRMIEFTQVLGLACPFYTEGVGKCVKAIFVAPDHFRVMCGPEKTKE
jgi:hypothetical protein